MTLQEGLPVVRPGALGCVILPAARERVRCAGERSFAGLQCGSARSYGIGGHKASSSRQPSAGVGQEGLQSQHVPCCMEGALGRGLMGVDEVSWGRPSPIASEGRPAGV